MTTPSRHPFARRFVARLARVRLPRALDSERLLVVKSTSLGDFTVFLPFLASLREQHAGRPIDLLLISRTGNVASQLLRSWEGDTAVVDPTSRQSLSASTRAARAVLAARHSEVIFAPQTSDVASTYLKRLALARAVAGVGARFRGWSADARLKDRGELSRSLDPMALNQAHAPFVATDVPLTATRASTIDLLLLTPAERQAAERAHARLRGAEPRVAMYVNAKDDRKRWPLAGYEVIGRQLMERGAAQLVFVGGPEDAEASAAVARAVGLPDASVVAGTLTPRETLAFLQGCALFVGNDGAPMHLAALAGLPVAALFCNWEPPGIWEPIAAPRSIALRPPMNVRGGSGFGIDTLPASAVTEAIRSLLDGAAGHQIWIHSDGAAHHRRVVDRLFPVDELASSAQQLRSGA
jgi:ADP-heptose:LPS heptosyltransferase